MSEFVQFFVEVVMKELLDGGLINGECLTVTGHTVSENLSSTPCVHDLAKQVSITGLRICILVDASTLFITWCAGHTLFSELSLGSCWTSHDYNTGMCIVYNYV